MRIMASTGLSKHIALLTRRMSELSQYRIPAQLIKTDAIKWVIVYWRYSSKYGIVNMNCLLIGLKRFQIIYD